MRNGTFARRLALALLAVGMLAIASSSAQAGELADRARGYLGRSARELGLPRSLWCADFVNMLLGRRHASRVARSYARYGRPAAPGCVGCIAVLRRRGGGHVGIVEGWKKGNPIVISGNHNDRVGEGVYPRARLVALREPEI